MFGNKISQNIPMVTDLKSMAAEMSNTMVKNTTPQVNKMKNVAEAISNGIKGVPDAQKSEAIKLLVHEGEDTPVLPDDEFAKASIPLETDLPFDLGVVKSGEYPTDKFLRLEGINATAVDSVAHKTPYRSNADLHAIKMKDGTTKLFAIGGYYGSSSSHYTALIYDPLTRITIEKNFTGSVRVRNYASAVYNNKIYIHGGNNGKTQYSELRIFDPEEMTMKTVKSNILGGVRLHRMHFWEGPEGPVLIVMGGIRTYGSSGGADRRIFSISLKPGDDFHTKQIGNLARGGYAFASTIAGDEIYYTDGLYDLNRANSNNRHSYRRVRSFNLRTHVTRTHGGAYISESISGNNGIYSTDIDGEAIYYYKKNGSEFIAVTGLAQYRNNYFKYVYNLTAKITDTATSGVHSYDSSGRYNINSDVIFWDALETVYDDKIVRIGGKYSYNTRRDIRVFNSSKEYDLTEYFTSINTYDVILRKDK